MVILESGLFSASRVKEEEMGPTGAFLESVNSIFVEASGFNLVFSIFVFIKSSGGLSTITSFDSVESELVRLMMALLFLPTGTVSKSAAKGEYSSFCFGSLTIALKRSSMKGFNESLQSIFTPLDTLPLYLPELKATSIYDLSPGGITIPLFFVDVQPHVGLTRVITSVSVPVFSNQKS